MGPRTLIPKRGEAIQKKLLDRMLRRTTGQAKIKTKLNLLSNDDIHEQLSNEEATILAI